MPAKTNPIDSVVERIDAALAAGTVPWSKPWIGGHSVARNLKTRKPYRGINVLLLALSPNAGQWWVTYKQAQALGGQVRGGEEGTGLILWKPFCKLHKQDPNQCRRQGRSCTRDDHTVFARTFTVFNAETQCDGLDVPKPERREVDNENAVQIGLRFEHRLDYYLTVHEAGDQAFYNPQADDVTMPPTNLFTDGRRYYWAAAHELVHSTGHADRLNRKGITDTSATFGTPEYAREELVAEIGSCILAFELGFEPDIDQSAAYIKGWREAIAEDHNLLTVAAGRAAKAVDMLLTKPTTDDTEGEDYR